MGRYLLEVFLPSGSVRGLKAEAPYLEGFHIPVLPAPSSYLLQGTLRKYNNREKWLILHRGTSLPAPEMLLRPQT